MRITFLGHVGAYVETRGGSVLCDPWFTPAYFGSWFPFPRNDGLDPERFARPDYLYISHLHHDHFDPAWIAAHVDRDTAVLLPDYRGAFLERELRGLGFERFVRTRDGETVDLDGLRVTILAFDTPADGPLGDSLIVIDDGTARVLNQNDARPGDLERLRDLGPFDAQMVQFSGAIWYPIAYDFPVELKRRLATEKRVNQMARARQYVEWVDAAYVFPCAGPPAFLDAELWEFNDFDRDPANIFPDQSVFLDLLAAAGIGTGRLLVPGSVAELADGECRITHPGSEVEIRRPFTDKRAALEEYRADWSGWLAAERASWSSGRRDLVAGCAALMEPVLARAPVLSAAVAGNVVIDVGEPGADVCIDFVASAVRAWSDEPYVYKIDTDRRLVEALLERAEPDWVNSLFLSCRFVAHRPDAANFNEAVMTFFKALTPDRIDYVERCLVEQRSATDTFERDGWIIERWCPHRGADLTRFGEIADGVLTCSLHHWKFDLPSGRCLTSDDRSLRCRRVGDDEAGAGEEGRS